MRNNLISPYIGEHAGHIVSTAIFCIVLLLVAKITIPWINPGSIRKALGVGLFWVSLTVVFEFLAGHYLFGNSWATLYADYNILRGRVWVLVLIMTIVAPVLVERWRAGKGKAA
jgi:hypothetical protein